MKRTPFKVPGVKCPVPGASAARSTKHQALSTKPALCALLALSLALSGCVYRGAKITEGTDVAIGLTVPGTEGGLQFNALNYLSGFRLGVAENAALTVEYSTVATNSYFGVVKTETAKRIKAKVEPCETEEAAVGRAVL